MSDIAAAHRQIRIAWVLAFAAVWLFAIFSLLHIQQPIAQDDLYYLVAAETLYETGTPHRFGSPDRITTLSPELYLQSLALAFRLFGESIAVARLPGIMAGVLSIGMVFLITNSLSTGPRHERLQWASLTTLLYALTPGVVQGGLILASENTVLIPSVLLLCWAFSQCQEEPTIRWAVLTGTAMAIALWGRVMTPLIMGGVMGVYALVGRSRVKNKLVPVAALMGGVGLFLFSWYVYAMMLGVPFSGPFTYAADVFMYKMRTFKLLNIATDMISVVIWVGIFSVLLLAVLVGRRGSAFVHDRQMCREDVFLLSGLCLCVGYLMVGGVIFGYPKYLSPAMPLLFVYAGVRLSRTGRPPLEFHGRTVSVAVSLVVLACIIQIFTVGDWAYIYRYRLRETIALTATSPPGMWNDVGLKAALFCVAFGVLIVSAVRLSSRTIIGILYACSVGSNFGVTLLQGMATYQTGYNHGALGTVETAQYIRSRVPAESVVIAPNEVTYYLRLPNSPYWANAFWEAREQLRARLADRNTSGLAYSVATNTIDQVRFFSADKPIQELLRHNYDRTTVGSYTIWIRKKDLLLNGGS